jgi:hypothetical protein
LDEYTDEAKDREGIATELSFELDA